MSLIAAPMHLSGDLYTATECWVQLIYRGCVAILLLQFCNCVYWREVTGCCVICVMMAINRQESSGNNVLFMFYVYAIVHCILSV